MGSCHKDATASLYFLCFANSTNKNDAKVMCFSLKNTSKSNFINPLYIGHTICFTLHRENSTIFNYKFLHLNLEII
jgi:hypothetical protein